MARTPGTPPRPDLNQVDDTVQKGFSRITWIIAAVILVALAVSSFLYMGRAPREASPPNETARPERTVPPQGQTGDVPQSQSPVQR